MSVAYTTMASPLGELMLTAANGGECVVDLVLVIEQERRLGGARGEGATGGDGNLILGAVSDR